MLEWYQHIPQRIDPIVFTVSFFSLYWYAAMFLLAIAVSGRVLWAYARKRFSFEQYLDLVTHIIIGIFVGARLGYVLFYNLPFYISHPLAIISPFDIRTGAWTGVAGMSYFGGLIGCIAAAYLFARKQKIPFWDVADMIAFAAPIGYFFGRIGNFLNGELYGRMTEKIWGMYFYDSSGMTGLRHPSQLYEAFFEGLVLSAVPLIARRHIYFPGGVAALYVAGYGFFRFFLEFFREPDFQSGLFFGWMSLGQIFSAAAFFGGIALLSVLKNRR